MISLHYPSFIFTRYCSSKELLVLNTGGRPKIRIRTQTTRLHGNWYVNTVAATLLSKSCFPTQKTIATNNNNNNRVINTYFMNYWSVGKYYQSSCTIKKFKLIFLIKKSKFYCNILGSTSVYYKINNCDCDKTYVR